MTVYLHYTRLPEKRFEIFKLMYAIFINNGLLFTIFYLLFPNKNHKLHHISNYIQNSESMPLGNFVSLHMKYLYSFKKCQGHLTLFMYLSRSSKSKIKSSSLRYYMYRLLFTFVRITLPALYLSC